MLQLTVKNIHLHQSANKEYLIPLHLLIQLQIVQTYFQMKMILLTFKVMVKFSIDFRVPVLMMFVLQ